MSWSYYGGNIAELPKPRRRRYGTRKREKRPVKVSVHKYYGLGQHYWVSLHEDDNPIWDKKEKGWRFCWDDNEGKGRIFSEPFLSMLSAQLWIEEMVKTEFPKKHFELNTNLNGLTEEDEKVWFGTYKEGD